MNPVDCSFGSFQVKWTKQIIGLTKVTDTHKDIAKRYCTLNPTRWTRMKNLQFSFKTSAMMDMMMEFSIFR